MYARFSWLLFIGCSEYDLAAKRDVQPGALDTGSAIDFHTTEDTAPPPTCDDFEASPVGAVEPREDCLAEPAVGTFTPTIEWQWSVNDVQIGFDHIMASPAIGNLTDDNGDGQVNTDDIPDVVFTAFAGSAYSSPGALNAISGDGSGLIWSVREPGGYPVYGAAGVALGDLDGDGSTEVCAASSAASVVCVNGEDGSFKWAGGTETSSYGCPAMADLDGDGLSEVIFGRTVLDHTGATLWTGAGGTGGPHYMSFAIDWTGDGQLDIVAGNTIYNATGEVVWTDARTDAAPAIGDFDLDGLPDLVRAGGGTIVVTLNDGSLLWEAPTSGGGSAGAPTVADFDGDGLPEVGVADRSRYSVYDTDGALMWSNVTSDYSSSKTGSSVFDFEGDGAAEVVYADEHTLWIFDGATGFIKLAQEGHASGTLMEYPLIADVDNDGSTEIVVASNDYNFSGWTGITVLGDSDGTWAAARPIWNQYAYHITNVSDDGHIPATQVPNWLTWNSFRAGGTELGPAHWLPDVAPRPPDICTATCEIDRVTVYLPVANHGISHALNVVVVLERDDGTQIDVKTMPVVPHGGGVVLGPVDVNLDQWGTEGLNAIVDWPDDVSECNEANNTLRLGPWPCD